MSNLKKSVLILGGGVAGLSAAKTLAGKGFSVHLVEKNDHLGGKALEWACMATETCENCGACQSGELVDQVLKQNHTTIYTQTQLSGLDRKGYGFEAFLEGEFSGPIIVDAVLMATGFSPFDPSLLPSLGYGKHPKVVTTVELNELLKTGRINELIPDQTSPKIAFIQCVGSRNRKLNRNYCSQVCCKISLRHANKLHYLYPQADITIFHMDLQIIGKEFRHFADKLAGHVKLMQGVAAEILSDRQEGKLTVFHEDESIGVRAAHHFDLVVLSVGFSMAENVGELALKLGVKPDPWGFLNQKETEFPNGIYSAGTTCGPMNILSSISQGQIAASRIADDLITGLKPAKNFRVAVLGGGNDAASVSTALANNGYPVTLIDSGKLDISLNEHIHQFANSRLFSAEGFMGNFSLGIENSDGISKEIVGAIVVASGSKKMDPVKSADAGPLINLERFINYPEEKIPQKVTFWLDYSGHENKENARKVLEQATLLAKDGKTVHILMEKMLVHGLMGQNNYDSARKSGVKFLRIADRAKVRYEIEKSQVKLTLEDTTLPATEISFLSDLLVIPEKVIPSEDTSALAQILKQATDLEGYIQSPNTRHRPVASPRKGIFFAGSCHDETDNADLNDEISAIIAGIEHLRSNGTPEGYPAQIYENECIKCLTCLRVCPHGAVVLLASNKPQIVPEACFECGLCVSNCPAKAIRQEMFTDSDLTEGIHKGETVVFACERSAFLAKEEALRLGLNLDGKIHVFPVRCAGRIGIENMLAPLVQGAARVIVAGCHEGNCRSMESGVFAQRRISHTIEELGIGSDKLSFYPVAANEPAKFKEILSDRK